MASSEAETPTGDIVQVMRADLQKRGLLRLDSGDDVANRITAKILTATDIAGVFATQQMQDVEDWLRETLEIQSVTWQESSIEGSAGLFAVVTAVDVKTGEEIMFSTGARQVVAQLYQLVVLEAFPVKVQIVEAKRASKNGYFAQWLELVK